MKKLTAVLLLAALWTGLAAGQTAAPEGLFSQIESIFGELGEISGLKSLRKIDYDLIDRSRVKQFLEERIRIYNPTEAVRPYYFWNCTAAPCTKSSSRRRAASRQALGAREPASCWLSAKSVSRLR